MTAMTYLFGAYFVLWAITFGYVFSLSAHQKRLQQELELVRERNQVSAPSTLESK